MKNLKLLLIVSLGFILSCCNDINELLTEKTGAEEVIPTIPNEFLTNEILSENEAEFIAKTFTLSNILSTSTTRTTRDLEIENVFPLLIENNQILAYAVNFKNGGYNIVSATQKYSPVIAFSEEGNIQPNYKDENPSLAFWLDFMKEDMLYQINKDNDSDSISINNRKLWKTYEAAALTNENISRTTTKDHRYWYSEERNKAYNMSFTDPASLMSEDLQRLSSIILTDYGNRNYLTNGEITDLKTANSALKSTYSRAGLNQSPAFFWNEYNKGYNKYNIEALVKTRWHQEWPYNLLNPLKNNAASSSNPNVLHQPLGCVAIAISQILNYYRYPQTLSRKDELVLKTLTMDWNKTNIVSLADSTLLDIPTLIRFINKGVFTKNGDNSSGSNVTRAKDFLELNGYSVRKYEGHNIGLLIAEIKANRPAYVEGFDAKKQGHAFICNGYKAVEKRVTLELTRTSSMQIKDFSSNPYYMWRKWEGDRIITEEYLSFNWGGGGLNGVWIIRPANSAMDFHGFNNEVEILAINKR